MKRYLSIVCVALLMPAFVHAQDDKKKDEPKQEPAKSFVVPFELIATQHMVVSIKVNGKGPYRLVFDTGAPDSLVSSKIANEAQIFGKGKKKVSGGLFGGGGQAKIKEIEIGDMKAENITAMVLDHPTVQAISSVVGPLDGILGFTFYARYKMSIDYEKKLITFEPNTYQPGNVMEAMMARMMAPKSVREAPRILAPAGVLGLKVEKAKEDIAAGVLIKEVMPESPAARAGIKTGDRLLTLDGRWTDSVTDTYIAASHLRTGVPTLAQVLRGKDVLKLNITVRAGL